MTCHDCGSHIELGEHFPVPMGSMEWDMGSGLPVSLSVSAVICVECLEIQERPVWRSLDAIRRSGPHSLPWQ